MGIIANLSKELERIYDLNEELEERNENQRKSILELTNNIKEMNKTDGFIKTATLATKERMEKIMNDALTKVAEKQKEEAMVWRIEENGMAELLSNKPILLKHCNEFNIRTEQSYKDEIATLKDDVDCYKKQYEQQKAFKEDVMDSYNCMHEENEQLKKHVENQRKSIIINTTNNMIVDDVDRFIKNLKEALFK